jgi:hypothetical protein
MLAPESTYALQQITDAVNENAALMSWAQALLNTTLPPLTPQPAWYASINATLQSQRSAARDWLNVSGPSTFAALTQTNVDFANVFVAAVPQLTALVSAITAAGGAPTPDQLSQLVALLTKIQESAQAQSARVAQAQKAMSAYATQVTTDREALSTAMSAALAAQAQDAVTIQQIQGQIQLLQLQVAALSARAGDQDISSQTSLFTIVIGMTFGLAAAGGTLALGGLAGALVGVGGGAVMSHVYTAEIQATMEEIVNLTKQLGAAEIQLALVQGTITSLQALTAANQSTLATINNASNIWTLVLAQLEGVLVALAQPQVNVSLVTELLGLHQAAAVWQRVSTFCQEAQKMPMQSQTLDLPETIIPRPSLKVVP